VGDITAALVKALPNGCNLDHFSIYLDDSGAAPPA